MKLQKILHVYSVATGSKDYLPVKIDKKSWSEAAFSRRSTNGKTLEFGKSH